jgi:hypothetical protein
LVGRAFLEDEPAGADLDRFRQVVLIVVHRKKDDARLRPRLADLPGGFEAAHPSHSDIHQHDIGPGLRGQGYSVGGVGRLADDFDIRLGRQKRAHSLPEQGVVVS